MINLTDHVTSLDLSMKLKEAGMPQESIFYWGKIQGQCDMHEIIFVHAEVFDSCLVIDPISAYTASELMGLLPSFINGIPLFIKKFDNFYECGYFLQDDLHVETLSLAESLGGVALNLIENKLMCISK